jgi:hypothetical protein
LELLHDDAHQQQTFSLSRILATHPYYLGQVLRYQRPYFPGLVSYNRFVELLPGALVPLCCFLVSRFGQCSGISFIDSTKIRCVSQPAYLVA